MFWFAVVFFVAYLSLWICGRVLGWRMEDEPPILGLVIGYVVFQAMMAVLFAGWHVIIAWLIGLRVFGVSVGVGPRIARWRLGDFTLDIHPILTASVCRSGSKAASIRRWQMVTFMAAGPLLNLAIVVTTAFFAATDFSRKDLWHFYMWLALLGVNFLMLIGSLVLGVSVRPGKRRKAKGKIIWSLLRSEKSAVAWKVAYHMLAIQSYVEMNHIQKAREELEQARKIGVESRARSRIHGADNIGL